MSTGQILREATTVDRTAAPSLVPDRAIDLDHLADTAHGDRATMNEMLELFDLQIDMLLARMASEEPRAAAARAHTLAVAARAVGAFGVAESASAFERIATAPGPVVLGAAMHRLSRAATEAQSDIQGLIATSRGRA